eukprot:scaffold106888_cov57-Phaeocystis_antarctica.AAC.1
MRAAILLRASSVACTPRSVPSISPSRSSSVKRWSTSAPLPRSTESAGGWLSVAVDRGSRAGRCRRSAGPCRSSAGADATRSALAHMPPAFFSARRVARRRIRALGHILPRLSRVRCLLPLWRVKAPPDLRAPP